MVLRDTGSSHWRGTTQHNLDGAQGEAVRDANVPGYANSAEKHGVSVQQDGRRHELGRCLGRRDRIGVDGNDLVEFVKSLAHLIERGRASRLIF